MNRCPATPWVLTGTIIVAICGGTAVPRAGAAEPRIQHAEDFVRGALRAEISGQPQLRTTLLQEALNREPGHAPAHWHSGQVRLGDEWVSVPQAELRAAGNKVLAAYAALRERMPDSRPGHFAAAVFCRHNGLEDRERWHWRQVLNYEPGNKEAIQALGLRKYRQVWLTSEEIEQYERSDRQAKEAKRDWEPVAKRLRRTLAEGDADERLRAVQELRAIRDASSVPYLEAAFADADEEHQLALLEAWAQMPEPAAHMAIVRTAVLATSAAVREAAAERLQVRSVFSYVPLLVGNLAAPIELVYYRPGSFTWECGFTPPEFVLLQEGPLAYQSLTLTGGPGLRSKAARVAQIPGTVLPVIAAANPTRLERAVSVANTNADALNARLIAALQHTTGQTFEEPRQWWEWWVDHNELYRSERKPVLEFHGTCPMPCSCFVAGTPVWAEQGSVAIEKVRPGDRVLSQDPESGELAYKLVIGTTVRPPSPILRITVQGRDIYTTRGHLFWRVGQGWRMAKELNPGDELHTLSGAVTVDGIKDYAAVSAHNLVVADFATYFVDEPRLLVHDNTARQAVDMALPGLTQESVQASMSSRPAACSGDMSSVGGQRIIADRP